VDAASRIKIVLVDVNGKVMKVLADQQQNAGVYTINWNMNDLAAGTYVVTALKNGVVKQSVKVVKQ
jgi:methionine-rich copper-binding protein CopC